MQPKKPVGMLILTGSEPGANRLTLKKNFKP